MMIYTLSVLLSSFFAYVYQYTKKMTPSRKTLYGLVPRLSIVLSCAILVILSGTRVGVGVDYYSYERIFHAINSGKSTFVEIGFEWLNIAVGFFTDSSQWIFFVTSLITLVLLYVFMARYSKNMAYSVFLLFGLCLIFFSFNTMRQFIAIAIAMMAFGPLLKRQFIKYATIVVIATLFHITALVMLPLYFLLNIRYTKLKIIIIAAVSIGVYLLSPVIIDLFLTIYPQHADNEALLAGTQLSEVFVLTPILLLLLISRMLKHKRIIYKGEDRIYINIILMILFFHLAFSWIPGMDRVNLYLDVMLLVAIPYVTNKLSTVNARTVIMVSVIYFSIYAFTSTYINDSHHVLPYQSSLTSFFKEGR